MGLKYQPEFYLNLLSILQTTSGVYNVCVDPPGQAVTPQGLKFKVVELPYHSNISMLIALPPEEETSLSAIIPHVSTAAVQGWVRLLTQRKVRLLLPR